MKTCNKKQEGLHLLVGEVHLPGCNCQNIRRYNIITHNIEGKETDFVRLEIDSSTGNIIHITHSDAKPISMSVIDASEMFRQG